MRSRFNAEQTREIVHASCLNVIGSKDFSHFRTSGEWAGLSGVLIVTTVICIWQPTRMQVLGKAIKYACSSSV